jgi:hypothetical protein
MQSQNRLRQRTTTKMMMMLSVRIQKREKKKRMIWRERHKSRKSLKSPLNSLMHSMRVEVARKLLSVMNRVR